GGTDAPRSAAREGPGRRAEEAGEGERRRLDRAGAVEVDLAEPDSVEALGLPGVGQVDGLAQRRALADAAPPLLEKDPEVHGSGSSARASCAAGSTSSSDRVEPASRLSLD